MAELRVRAASRDGVEMKARQVRRAASRARGAAPDVGREPRPLSRGAVTAAVCGILAVYAGLRVHYLDVPLDRDEGLFGYVGQRMLHGGLPYVDGFDHKPPLIFYLNELALTLVPPTARGIHLFLQTYNVLTMAAVGAAGWVLGRSPAVALWTALAFAVFSASPTVQGFTASTEMFTLLPLASSVLLGLLARRRPSMPLLLGSGASAAAAVWVRQTALAPVAIVPIMLAWPMGAPWPRASRAAVHAIAVWCAAAAVLSAAFTGYLWARGVLHEFVYWCFIQSIAYENATEHATNLVMERLRQVVVAEAPVVIAAVALVARLARRDPDARLLLLFVVLSLVAVLPGVAYPHYFAQLAPAMALAAGYGISATIRGVRDGRSRAVAGVTAAALVVGAPLVVHGTFLYRLSPHQMSRSYFGPNPFPESEEVAAYLASHTAPTDRVFIFGSEAEILLLSERHSATPFVDVYALMRENPRIDEFQHRAFADIETFAPRYVLFVAAATSVLWDGKASTWFFDQVQQLLARSYALEAVVPIADPEGRLLLVAEHPEMGAETTGRILVYRRK